MLKSEDNWLYIQSAKKVSYAKLCNCGAEYSISQLSEKIYISLIDRRLEGILFYRISLNIFGSIRGIIFRHSLTMTHKWGARYSKEMTC